MAGWLFRRKTEREGSKYQSSQPVLGTQGTRKQINQNQKSRPKRAALFGSIG